MARRPKQLKFLGKDFAKPSDVFGGELLKGHRAKCKRPLDSKRPIHLCLRARKGGMRQPKVAGHIDKAIATAGRKHGIRVYSHSNVGNHLHLVIRITNRQRWCAFIRELTGRIALLMKRTNLAEKGESFWLYAPFTRLIAGWGRAYRIALDYVHLNQLQAEGIINRRETKTLKDYRLLFA